MLGELVGAVGAGERDDGLRPALAHHGRNGRDRLATGARSRVAQGGVLNGGYVPAAVDEGADKDVLRHVDEQPGGHAKFVEADGVDLRSLGDCPPGEVSAAPAGGLDADHVVHSQTRI